MAVSPGDLTFVTTCKGRLSHLQKSLPRMCAQQGAQVVVVDYACPDGAANWVRANFPQVTVVREQHDTGWVASRARNMGAAAVKTSWIMFIDADMLLDDVFAARVFPSLEPGKYYRAAPWSMQNWGNVICERTPFLKFGGYDEVYRGWSVEDDDLYDALEMQGARRSEFPSVLMSEIDHGNELRTRFHDVSMMTSYRINKIYRQIKLDITHIIRSSLPLAERQRIFDEVKRRITNLENGARSNGKLIFRIPDLVPSAPPSIPASEARNTRLTRALQYEIILDGDVPGRNDLPSE